MVLEEPFLLVYIGPPISSVCQVIYAEHNTSVGLHQLASNPVPVPPYHAVCFYISAGNRNLGS